jgi:hypothetical protein
MFSDRRTQTSMLRVDIREEIARESGENAGGGDFYAPFWYDAKQHVLGRQDLHDATRDRIGNNERRSNLYPRLRDGFLLWWNERRRWTNEPFQEALSPKARMFFDSLSAVVKIENVLAVSDGDNVQHYIYPYFSPNPMLTDESARLALWVLTKSLSSVDPDEVRILDVIRGSTFSLDRNPLQGDEERIFNRRYAALINEWNGLWEEYE